MTASVDMLIDTGASVNVVDRSCFEKLRFAGLKLTKSKIRLFPYGSQTPLPVEGQFSATIRIPTTSQDIIAGFVVVNSPNATPLLGRKTAQDLGLLHFGLGVNNLNARQGHNSTLEALLDSNKDVFKGVGKLKDFQLHIHVDPQVTPVAQTPRRLPFHVFERVEDKLGERESLDIIEALDGPTPWVSPLLVVPKANGEVRICVDMRQRERHPISTLEETLHEVNGTTVFSKLDPRWGYHQIELEPESRGITIFTTHKGLRSYKRLMFGITSAPEVYQHVIQQALHGCQVSATYQMT